MKAKRYKITDNSLEAIRWRASRYQGERCGLATNANRAALDRAILLRLLLGEEIVTLFSSIATKSKNKKT